MYGERKRERKRARERERLSSMIAPAISYTIYRYTNTVLFTQLDEMHAVSVISTLLPAGKHALLRKLSGYYGYDSTNVSLIQNLTWCVHMMLWKDRWTGLEISVHHSLSASSFMNYDIKSIQKFTLIEIISLHCSIKQDMGIIGYHFGHTRFFLQLFTTKIHALH